MAASGPAGMQVPIRALRRAWALTQPEVVERLAALGVKIDVPQLSRIETGTRGASPKVVQALAAVYQLNPLDIWQPEPSKSEAAS